MNETVIGAPNRAPLLHLAERALNRPLIIHPDKAAIIMDVLSGRLGIQGPELGALSPEANRFMGSSRRDDGSYSVNRIAGGVAIVSIVGTLVNRGGWIGASSGLVSYEGILTQLREAAIDASVHSVILDIDTGGGEAGGITAVAAAIHDLKRSKRVVAVVNDTAASGGYWIASAADEIVVSETSMVGSIGVVVLHVNRAGELQQKGWDATFIHAGAHKVDGHSLGPLPASVRADVQAAIDTLYDGFVKGVAAGRGARLSEEAARATEARVFHGQAAIAAGLADRLGTFEGVLAELQSRRTGPAGRQPPKGTRMSADNNTQPGVDTGITQAAHDAAVTTARAEGATAERARIKAIMTSEAAAERPNLAQTIAFESDMSAEAAASIIAAGAVEKPKAQTPPLADRHAAAGTGAGAEGPGGAEAAANAIKPGVMKNAAAKVAERRAGN
ncbi:S49 family peptidase [Paracoccus sp. KR1-242]|uniref:S49 family peptidase n=1 Tax=Paracoccus sp. KR1-242 TaxID=3410028 RepID=UPI003C0FE40A